MAGGITAQNPWHVHAATAGHGFGGARVHHVFTLYHIMYYKHCIEGNSKEIRRVDEGNHEKKKKSNFFGMKDSVL